MEPFFALKLYRFSGRVFFWLLPEQFGVPGRVERTPEMFRLALYSPLLSPFGTRECHKIQPCTLGSLPLTEACLRFSRTSLFIRSFTRWD